MSDTPQPSSNLAQDTNQNLTHAADLTKEKLKNDPTLAHTLAPTEDLQTIVIDIEKELLATIMNNLDQNKLSVEKAQALAKEFLALLPIDDQKDLLEKLQKLSQENQDVKSIYLKYAHPYEAQERERKLALMSQHIHQGDVEKALAIAKGEQHG